MVKSGYDTHHRAEKYSYLKLPFSNISQLFS